jgi:hypothetical protein
VGVPKTAEKKPKDTTLAMRENKTVREIAAEARGSFDRRRWAERCSGGLTLPPKRSFKGGTAFVLEVSYDESISVD